MELKTAIEILEYHQEWRLGKREDMIHEPKKLTEALDIVLNEVKKFRLGAVIESSPQMNNNAETQQSAIQLISGSLQDIQEIIGFLQWAFRKVDKGDTPEETVRMLLMNRAKIDNIKFDSITTKK